MYIEHNQVLIFSTINRDTFIHLGFVQRELFIVLLPRFVRSTPFIPSTFRVTAGRL